MTFIVTFQNILTISIIQFQKAISQSIINEFQIDSIKGKPIQRL